MDDLQYVACYNLDNGRFNIYSFKPCYKWMTFNTAVAAVVVGVGGYYLCFKPCYKWMTFNTGYRRGYSIHNRFRF